MYVIVYNGAWQKGASRIMMGNPILLAIGNLIYKYC